MIFFLFVFTSSKVVTVNVTTSKSSRVNVIEKVLEKGDELIYKGYYPENYGVLLFTLFPSCTITISLTDRINYTRVFRNTAETLIPMMSCGKTKPTVAIKAHARTKIKFGYFDVTCNENEVYGSNHDTKTWVGRDYGQKSYTTRCFIGLTEYESRLTFHSNNWASSGTTLGGKYFPGYNYYYGHYEDYEYRDDVEEENVIRIDDAFLYVFGMYQYGRGSIAIKTLESNATKVFDGSVNLKSISSQEGEFFGSSSSSSGLSPIATGVIIFIVIIVVSVVIAFIVFRSGREKDRSSRDELNAALDSDEEP